MKFKWDGKSRPSDDKYRKRWDEIFGKKEEEELKESYEQSKRNKIERQDLIDSIIDVEKKSGKDLVSLIIDRKRKENRLMIFDGRLKHTGTTPTDSKKRVVINFNFFSENMGK